MNIKNLQRAAELAVALPALDEARKGLAKEGASLKIVTMKGETIHLPASLNYNIINVLNCEYERLREEAARL